MDKKNYMETRGISCETSRSRAFLSCLMDVAVFCLGVALPGISFASKQVWFARNLMERVAPVDIFVIIALFMLTLARGLKVKLCGVLYGLALVVSLLVAFILGGWNMNVGADSGVALLALMMSFLYWLLGYNIARWPYLMRIYLLGIACGVAWEGLIVLHDYFMPADKWFMDNKFYRVRGTFRKSGQLGTYGLSCAGIMFSIGIVMFRRHAARIFVAAMGLLSCFIVFASSRRTGMIALAVWGVLSLFFLFWKMERKHQWKLLFVLLASFFCAVLLLLKNPDSFFVKRWVHFVSVLTNPDSFPYQQIILAAENCTKWFPFGLGVGRGQVIANGSEFHNANLALLVEIGLFGFAMFYWMIFDAGLSWWRTWKAQRKPYIAYIFICFLSAAMVYMMHNRVHRSRGFMLMLGLASGASISATVRRNDDLPASKEENYEK